MPKKKNSRTQRLADDLVDLIGPGPTNDPGRLEHARLVLDGWSSAQSSVFGMIRELKQMRDFPETYRRKENDTTR